MWDETLIESKRKPGERRKWLTLVFSVTFHFLAVGAILFGSFWYLEAVTPVARPQSFYHVEQLPSDFIPLVIKRGTQQGNDRTVATSKIPPVLQPSAPATQDINPNSDVDLSNTPASTPFDLNVVEPDGTGPRGDPEGATEEGATSGLPGDGVFTITQPGVQQPVLIHRIQPEYPETMRLAHIQGLVVLSAVITRTGDVEVKEVLRSLNAVLDREAIRAVSQWKYRPALLNNRPVSVWFTVSVDYKLR